MARTNADSRNFGPRPDSKRIIIGRSKTRPILIAVAFTALILVVVTLLYLLLTGDVPQLTAHYTEQDPPDVDTPLPPSPAKLKTFLRGAVCSDSPPCAQIARDTLALRSSSVIDATIAGVFCNAVYSFHASGLGGGFVFTYFRKQEGTIYVLNARETAPLNVTAEFCAENAEQCRKGARAAGVPGALLGLHTLWKRWGQVPWDSLVRPSILLCTSGFNMTAHMYHAAHKNREALIEDEYMRETLFNTDSHTIKLTGSWIKPPPKLCDTLKLIAQQEAFEFYEGVLGDDFALDVKEMDGVMDRNDLRKFRVMWNDASATQLTTGHTLYAPPTPHSGDLLVFTTHILNGIAVQLRSNDANSTLLALHRMLETFKYAETFRNALGEVMSDNITQVLTNLRSRSFADAVRLNISDDYVVSDYTGPLQETIGSQGRSQVTRRGQDGGYSQLSLLSQDGDAVSVTSSLGSYFGAKVSSRRTGLLLNSAMGDFSYPSGSTTPGPAFNLPGPGKRPLSPSAPGIVLNTVGDVQLVLGATGEMATNALAQIIIKYILLNQGLKPAVDDARIFSKLQPSDVLYEYGILKKHIQELYRLGHVTTRVEGKYSTGMCVIARNRENKFEAIGDWRLDGEAFGI